MTLSIQIGQNNSILRKKAKQVKEITASIKQLALDMTETMEVKDGIGLAAPQVGQLLRIIVVKPEPNQETFILINPEIKKISRKKDVMEEGCLSLPNIVVPVERAIKITVQAFNLNGKKIKIKAKGLLARAIQHEVDHLEGILIVDKAKSS
jgi:peptide deformylase